MSTITPQPGYMIDPSNPNKVIRIDSYIPPSIAPTTLAQDMAKAANQGKAGYDVLGNPIASPTVAAPTAGSIYSGVGIDPALTSAYGTQLSAAQTASNQPIDEAAIRAQTLASFQAEIDAQNALYADKLAAAKVTGAQRIGQGTAIQARRGLLGSDFGSAQADNIVDANQGVYASIEAEKAASIASILSKARTAATDSIKEKTAAKQAGLDSYVKYLSEAATRKQTNAQTAAQLLLAQGHKVEDLSPEELAAITNGYGITSNDLLSTYKTLEKAQQAAEAKAAHDAQFVLGEGQQRYDASGKLIASGPEKMQSITEKYGSGSIGEFNFAKENGYTGTFSQYQNEDANRKAKVAGAGVAGLTAAQINATVNQIAGQFDNEPTVKDFNTVKRQVQLFNSLGTSATDDIQRVYAFAKIADPTSAVKEGEYNSIEKYSQAVLKRAGLKVSRVFTPTGILTPEARTAMGATVEKSLEAAQTGYDQVASEYQRQVDDAYSGKPRTITDYRTGGTNAGTKSEEQQLLDQGYTPEQIQAIKNAK